MKKALVLLTSACSLVTFEASAQVSDRTLQGDIFGTRVFVENKGQFDNRAVNGEKVHFGLDNGPEKMFFTSEGLNIEFRKATLSKREEEGEEREHEREEYRPEETPGAEFTRVTMRWKGANKDIRVVESEMQSHYITYGTADLSSRTFKKLLYKNVYNGIDVEFTFPSDKNYGIKYNVVLHPGADLSQFKMAYGGDIKKSRLKNGEVIIETELGNVVEHLPSTSYEGGEAIASSYRLNHNEITFELPSGYDKGRTVVIDPWLTSVTTLSTNNYAYDVDYDFFNAVYVYGGTQEYKTAKYSSAGTLLWTFAGVLSTPSWSTGYYAGNFAVHKYNQKCYIGQGFDGNGNRVIRLDPTGAYDNFITPQDPDFKEVWDMGFHCVDGGKLFVLGGGTSANISAVTIDQVTASMTLSTFQPTNNGAGQDVASHAIDDAGRIWVLYAASAGLNNTICKVNTTFNGNDYTVPSTYTTFAEINCKNGYPGSSGLSSNGFNALAVNANYLYYYDGFNLAAYDKNTGSKVASTTVPGHSPKAQGGIAVDDCNNLYIGGINEVRAYNFNGTSFSTLTPIAVNASSNYKNVLDIKLDKNNKVLYLSGTGFVGVFSPVHTLACPTASSICFSYALLDHIICAGTSVTLSSTSTQSLTNAGYTLQPNNITNSTGSFVVSPTVTTNYTIYLTGTDAYNVVVTSSAVSHVTVNPQPLVAPTVTQTGCKTPTNGINLHLTFAPPGANPGYTVTWAPIPLGITSPTQTSVTGNISPGVYNATVTADGGCTALVQVTIDPTPEPSVFFVVPGAPYVLTCYKPSITFSHSPATYNYTTTNQITAAQFGPNPVITFSNSQGTFVVTGEHPLSKCTNTVSFVVTHNTVTPTSVLSPTFQNITCTNVVQTVTASISPTVNIQHQWVSPYNTTLTSVTATDYFVPGAPGVYQHCAVNLVNGCRTCKDFTVTSSDGFPTFTINSAPPNFTLGCSSKSVTTIQITNGNTTPPGGAVSYTLLPPNFTGSLPGGTLSTLVNYPVSVPGNYTVVTRDNSNTCDTKIYVSVIMNTVAPTIDTVIAPYGWLTCFQPSMVLQGMTSSPNTFEKWMLVNNVTISGSTISVETNSTNPTGTVVGTYTYHLTDNNNLCTNQQSITVLQTIVPPVAGISGGTEISCKTVSTTLSNNSSSKVPPYFNPNNFVMAYMWMGPSPQVPLQASSNYVAWQPGTYTLIARDMSNGCFAVATKTIADNREIPIFQKPIGQAPITLDCGAESTTIAPTLQTNETDLNHTWTAYPSTLPLINPKSGTLTVIEPGEYYYTVQNNKNGCVGSSVYNVINGKLTGDFIMDKDKGYAPLTVSFTNTSRSTLDTSKVKAVWSFGNGTKTETKFAGSVPKAVYNQSGTYEVTMYVFKGSCADTVVKYVNVEIPSGIEIPNVFTPNGDGVNDLFFLHIANISKLQITIYDRWGNLVYDLETEKGNIEWDGKNQKGKPVAEGVYMYTLKAVGKDQVEYEKQGNITLVR